MPFGLLLGEPLHEPFAVDERDAVAFDELLGEVRPDDHDGSHPADVDPAGVEFARVALASDGRPLRTPQKHSRS